MDVRAFLHILHVFGGHKLCLSQREGLLCRYLLLPCALSPGEERARLLLAPWNLSARVGPRGSARPPTPHSSAAPGVSSGPPAGRCGGGPDRPIRDKRPVFVSRRSHSLSNDLAWRSVAGSAPVVTVRHWLERAGGSRLERNLSGRVQRWAASERGALRRGRGRVKSLLGPQDGSRGSCWLWSVLGCLCAPSWRRGRRGRKGSDGCALSAVPCVVFIDHQRPTRSPTNKQRTDIYIEAAWRMAERGVAGRGGVVRGGVGWSTASVSRVHPLGDQVGLGTPSTAHGAHPIPLLHSAPLKSSDS